MEAYNAKIMVHLDRTTGIVSPMLHGFLIEHAGQSVYDGIWTRGNTSYSKNPGLRTQIINPLRQVRPRLMQWPGGRFANLYHWEDGIGVPASRPCTENLIWGGEESNHFGTDEICRFCSKLSAEPHFCLNITTGSVREAVDWLEYCNLSENSRYGRKRNRSSQPEPFWVRYWSVGYEPWKSGGFMPAPEYAREFRRYAGVFNQLVPDLHMVACGHVNPAWNQVFLEALGEEKSLLRTLALSVSFASDAAGGSLPANETDYYALFGYLPMLEEQILQTLNLFDQVAPSGSIRLGFSEWGVQHPEAKKENSLLQPNTMRDALLAACTLHLFYRYSSVLFFAQLSQPVNSLHCLIRLHKEAMHFTPTFHVFDLLQPHLEQMSLFTQVSSPKLTIKNPQKTCKLPRIHAFSSISGNTLIVTLINLDMEKEAVISIYLRGNQTIDTAEVQTLAAESPNDENDFTSPHLVEPQEGVMDRIDNPAVKILPPASVTRLKLHLT